MSTHSSSHSERDRKSTKSLLKQLARYFQSLSLRQLQHETQILEDKKRKRCPSCNIGRRVENCKRER